jgi:outer membrane receptor protein involved in Fe transport
VGGDTTGKQKHSGYSEFAYDVKSKLQLTSATTLTIAHQFLQQQDVPLYHKILLENFAINAFHPQQRMLSYARLQLTGHSAFLQQVEVTASWQNTIEGRDSRKNGSVILRKERDEVNTLGLTTNISSRFNTVWSANSGIEMYHDKVGSTRQDINEQNGIGKHLRGLYPDGAQYGNYSAYSLHRFSHNKWIADAGVRYNIFSITINDTTLGRINIQPSSLVYNASLLYKLATGHHVYASYNTGFRAPNVDDMGTLGIVDFRYEVPSYNLSPERSANVEAGYKMRRQKWAAAVSGYYMRLSNLVTRVKSEGEMISGYPVYRKVNTDKGYIHGFEAEVEYQVTSSWKASGNIAYVKGQSITRMEPLRRIPPLFGRVMSTYNKAKWFASAELQFAGKQDRLAQGDKEDNRIPASGTPGWQIVNCYAGYTFSNLRLNVGLQNLLNEDYRTHGSGINGVGRSAFLSATVNF